jgi:hypothetical protein
VAKHQPEWLVTVSRVLEKIAAGLQDKFVNGSVPVKVLSKLFTATGNIRVVERKLAHGFAVGEVGTPSSLRQFASMMKRTALAPRVMNWYGPKSSQGWWQAHNDHKRGSALLGSLE